MLNLYVGEVQSILDERKAKYGEYASNHKTFNVLAKMIFIASDAKSHSPKVSRLLENARIIKSLMVIKAQRSLIEPNNKDHFIDFINYATFMKEIVDSGLIAFETGFVFNLAIDAYVKKTISLDEFVKEISEKGIILSEFRKDGQLLFSEIEAVKKSNKVGE